MRNLELSLFLCFLMGGWGFAQNVQTKGGRLQVTPNIISTALVSGKSMSKMLSLENLGTGTLDLSFEVVGPLTRKSFEQGWVELKPGPFEIVNLVVDPTTKLLYGFERNGYRLHRYHSESDSWIALEPSPIYSGYNADGAWHDGSLYFLLPQRQRLIRYNIASNSWTEVLETIRADRIASDGRYLYLLSYSNFYSFDPYTQALRELTRYSPGGTALGLEYDQGNLYVHQYDHRVRLFKYEIAQGQWSNLPNSWNALGRGSGIDGRNYYAPGSYNNKEIYRFNFQSQTWEEEAPLPTTVGDATLAHSGNYLYLAKANHGGRFFRIPKHDSIYTEVSVMELPGHTTQQLEVHFDATNLEPGSYERILVIESNDVVSPRLEIPLYFDVLNGPALEISPTTAVFEPSYPNIATQREILLCNLGNQDLVILNSTISGSEFSIEESVVSVGPGETKAITVEFLTAATGSFSGTLTLDTNDGQRTVALEAACIIPATIEVDPEIVNFTLESGNNGTTILNVKNLGQEEMTLDISIDSLTPCCWIGVSSFFRSIAAGESQDVEFNFWAHNLNAGIYEANAIFRTNDPATPELIVPMTLTVTGTPQIEVTPTNLDFSQAFVGFPTQQTLLIENKGTAPLVIDTITSDTAEFEVEPNQLEILPNQQAEVVVTFLVNAVGTYTGMVTINSNLDPVTINLSGTADLPPEIDSSLDLIDISLPFGGRDQQELVISNVGDSNLQGHFEIETFLPGPGTALGQTFQINYYQALARMNRSSATVCMDPDTGYLYAQTWHSADIFRYHPFHNRWEFFNRSLLQATSSAGSLVINGVLYVRYENQPGLIVMNLNNGERRVVDFEFSGFSLATDGTRLYIAGNGTLQMYNPADDSVTSLASPPPQSNNNAEVGIVFHDGYLYYVKGFGSVDFHRYHIATDAWESLPESPEPAGRLATVFEGKVMFPSDYRLMAYDPQTQEWSEQTWPFRASISSFLAARGGFLYVLGGFSRRELYKTYPNGWVHVPDSSFDIAPGESVNFEVLFDTAPVSVGSHQADLKIVSNDPLNPSVDIAVRMNVTESARLEVFPGTLVFPEAFLGEGVSTSLFLRNDGQLPINLTDFTASHADITIETSNVELAAGEEAIVELTFTPSVIGAHASTIQWESTLGVQMLEVKGLALGAPGLTVHQMSFHEEMDVGEQREATLRLTNNGQSALEIVGLTQVVQPLQPYVLSPQVLNQEREDVFPADALRDALRLNLADLSGVRIAHNSGYGWSMIRNDLIQRGAVLTEVSQVPENPEEYDIIWLIPPKNWSPESLARLHEWIASGGSLILEGDGNLSTNDLLPPSLDAELKWGNTLTFLGDRIYAHYTTQAIHFIKSSYSRAWLEFEGNGISLVDFPDQPPFGERHLVGVFPFFLGKIAVLANELFINEDLAQADNQRFANQLFDWMVIKAPRWLILDKESVTIPAGETRDIQLTFASNGLFAGDYSAEIHLSTNDPDNQNVVIPVSMRLNGTPNAQVDSTLLDFGHLMVGEQATQQFELTNTGTETLQVSNILNSAPEISVAPRQFDLAPSQSQTVYAVFQPTNSQILEDDLIIESDLPNLVIELSGSAQFPPEIDLNPASISMKVRAGLSRTTTFQVENQGLGPLNFQVFKDRVLVIGDGGSENDLISILREAGYDAVVVPNGASYTGTPHPNQFAAVVLLNGVNSGEDMPQEGQRTLLDYVQAGGGMLVFEWIEAEMSNGRYALFAPLCPLERTNSQVGIFDYEHAGNHPILAGVAPQFSLATGSNIGQAVAGEVLVTSPQAGDVVVYRPIGPGGVVQFASAGSWGGMHPFLNADFGKLVINAISWLAVHGIEIDQPETSVEPSGSSSVFMTVDAQTLNSGLYSFDLNVLSNDPEAIYTTLPVTVSVSCPMPEAYWQGLGSWAQNPDMLRLITLVNQPCN